MAKQTPAQRLTADDLTTWVMQQLQAAFPLPEGRKWQPQDYWRPVVAAAAECSTIHDVSEHLKHQPAESWLWEVLDRCLDAYAQQPQELEGKLNALLWQGIPACVQGKERIAAVDFQDIPTYRADAEECPYVRRRKPKDGTSWFYVVLTAFIIRGHYRITVAMTWWKRDETLFDAFQRLQGYLKAAGLQVEGFLLDKEFYQIDVLTQLQQEAYRVILPAEVRSQEMKALLQGKDSVQAAYTLRSEQGRVTVSVVITSPKKRKKRKKRKKGKSRRVAYVVLGKWKLTHTGIASLYRSRFGIETSHRQTNQAKNGTTTPRWWARPLFWALATWLRNIWRLVRVHIAARQGSRQARRWTLRRMLRSIQVASLHCPDWLANVNIRAPTTLVSPATENY